ncbi:MAG TPA: regulatory protein RecX [Bryobacteraceae bacterium]|nr:regulatory protein RecX [Bryobacteraceae bacterium]
MRPQARLDGDALFEYAVRALATRSYSAEELRTKLRRRAQKTGDVDPVISRLREIGYLNDERFAEMFTTLRVESDGFGRARVLSDLRARRVAPRVAEKAVTQAFAGKNEQEMIAAWIERRMPSVAAGEHTGDERQLAAAWRKLRRAGFSSGAILTELRRFAARPELLEDPPPEDEDGES